MEAVAFRVLALVPVRKLGRSNFSTQHIIGHTHLDFLFQVDHLDHTVIAVGLPNDRDVNLERDASGLGESEWRREIIQTFAHERLLDFLLGEVRDVHVDVDKVLDDATRGAIQDRQVENGERSRSTVYEGVDVCGVNVHVFNILLEIIHADLP